MHLLISNYTTKRSGFTLIEILVVMAIIGVLASIGFGSFQSSQQKARDAKRKAELNQVSRALELYYNDKGQYPDDDGGVIMGCANETACAWGVPFVDENDTIYMAQLPSDPRSNLTYFYDVAVDNKSFQLYARLENIRDGQSVGEGQVYGGTDCGDFSCNYGISSANTTPAEGHAPTSE